MKRRRASRSSKTARKPVFKLTPAEKAVEEIRERRRKLWRELGSAEAVEAFGRRIRLERMAAKKARRRSA